MSTTPRMGLGRTDAAIDPVELVLSRLPGHRRDGDGFIAPCPGHDDRDPSLSVGRGDDGRALVHCHAGCAASEIVAAMGLKMRDLMPLNGAARMTAKPKPASNGNPTTDWRATAEGFAQAITVKQIEALAGGLGVSVESLRALGCGWCAERHVYTFPERDGQGTVIGIATRGVDGRKGFIAGGKRGLTYALPFDPSKPAISGEGASDAAAILTLAGQAVNRPSNVGGVEHLAELLVDAVEPIIVGELDTNPDGRSPGVEGAQTVAAKLSAKLGRSVKWALPPEGAKDVRGWLLTHDAGEPADLLAALLDHLRRTASAQSLDEPAPMSIGSLVKAHPHLHPPVIDGLIRRGETANVIAPSKAGKSWLVDGLSLSIITGTDWLGRFRCTAGRVLKIDNELHAPTIAHRLPRVAEAMGVGEAVYSNRLDVLALRGRSVDLRQLGRYVDRIKRGQYAAIICDAWYRFIPAGANENANADVMALYNCLDQYAEATGAAWFVIHHASKGNQSEKSVTDTGAGAGAQSRAADAHLVLRPHEEPDHVVLDAAVRSFAPIDPLVLRWRFPLWEPVEGMDPAALKGRKSRGEERQDQRDAEGLNAIKAALANGPLNVRGVLAATGFGQGRAQRLLDRLTADGFANVASETGRGGTSRVYILND